ncbi:MAG: hypothetical protein JXX28_18525 [Deltaproteobacteria bacterium]|nr:hypothetical protein [Deltaproteobacteria bacterium]
MRLLAALSSLTLATPALAGGFGLITTGGAHTEILRFYDSSTEMTQYSLTETLPHMGGGVEVLLGDKDDRFIGVMRGFYMQDAPQTDPAELATNFVPDNVVCEYRREPRDVGYATVGLQMGVYGQPESLQVHLIGALGAGFLTVDHTEFLLGELGAGATYEVARNLRLVGDLQYGLRYRKGASYGGSGYLGVRYYID